MNGHRNDGSESGGLLLQMNDPTHAHTNEEKEEGICYCLFVCKEHGQGARVIKSVKGANVTHTQTKGSHILCLYIAPSLQEQTTDNRQQQQRV